MVTGADTDGVVTNVDATFSYIAPCTGAATITGAASGTVYLRHANGLVDARPFQATWVNNSATISGGVTGHADFVPDFVATCASVGPMSATVTGDIAYT